MSQVLIQEQKYSTLLKQAIGKYRQTFHYYEKGGRCVVGAILSEMGVPYRSQEWYRMAGEISETARQHGVCLHSLNMTHPWSKIVPLLEEAGL